MRHPDGDMVKALKALGWAMIWAGGLILAFLAYQLIGTNYLTSRAQDAAADQLEERFEEVRTELATAGALPPLEPEPVGSVDPVNDVFIEPLLYEEPIPDEGEPLGQIVIPAIGAEQVLMEGVARETLKAGPGHMPWTPLPGQPGNAVISGHRTTYGAPFFDLDSLVTGDIILVETALGTHTYQITEKTVVAPTDVWVTDPKRGAWLTLTTCHPTFSAQERLVIFAELIDGPNLAYAENQVEEFLEPIS